MSAMVATGSGKLEEDPSLSISLRNKRNGMFFDEETSGNATRRVSTGLELGRRQRVTS